MPHKKQQERCSQQQTPQRLTHPWRHYQQLHAALHALHAMLVHQHVVYGFRASGCEGFLWVLADGCQRSGLLSELNRCLSSCAARADDVTGDGQQIDVTAVMRCCVCVTWVAWYLLKAALSAACRCQVFYKW
jgi:hypothetical protein